MKLYHFKIIIILSVLFFAWGVAAPKKFVLALENESLNDDTPWDSSKELKDTIPSESLNDDDDFAKSSCPPPYVKLVSSQVATVGATVSIQGARFGDDTGQVIFPKGIYLQASFHGAVRIFQ
jgi:hypothetical protein